MDCNNPPKDDTFVECDDWKVIHINRKAKTCLIRKGKGKSYICKLMDWLVDVIMPQDYCDVKFNPISREWMVTNYRINPKAIV